MRILNGRLLAALLALAFLGMLSHSSRADYARVGDINMYYEVKGGGAAPAVVLLHGGTSSIEGTFRNQLADFAKTHRVIAIEQVGHGHTADRDGPFSYTRMADDTAALLAQLNVANADLIGWSDGGIIALMIARKHPELVRRVVISGANIRSSEKFREWARSITAEELAAKFPAAIREDHERKSPHGPMHWPVLVGKAKDLWATPVIIETADLAAVRAPVLVIAGEKDTIPYEQTLEISRTLPKAQLFIVSGTGHDTFQDAPAVMNPEIRRFLSAP